ncbi:MAG: hypothetical protein DLM72_08075 [Candidatus Nitrosopolaris wilkensis]|nr:MAG: hypothetical protein DLM72_08075 [Candidatus Nitrosopolaris wilkensis]
MFNSERHCSDDYSFCHQYYDQRFAIKYIAITRCVNAEEPEESAVAKSTGLQEENDVSMQDAALFRVLRKRYLKVRLITPHKPMKEDIH